MILATPLSDGSGTFLTQYNNDANTDWSFGKSGVVLLSDTGAPAEEILALDADQLDLASHRTRG